MYLLLSREYIFIRFKIWFYHSIYYLADNLQIIMTINLLEVLVIFTYCIKEDDLPSFFHYL